jgi:diguanylate cyclase (GGDEF)-like protein
MTSALHRLLERQYRDCSEGGELDVKRLLLAINASYLDNDRDLKRINRANALMAEDLAEMFSIREALIERSVRVEEIERSQAAITASELRIRHLAYHDSLTGLPNRALLSERLSLALESTSRSGDSFSLHLIDLDQFKVVNDTFGHLVGDELLQRASERLVKLCRRADTTARLGGDEFAIVHLNADRESAAALAERIVQQMALPIALSIGEVHLGCSLGVTVIEASSMDPLDCLRQADLALYKAKEAGRGQFAFFEPAMDLAVTSRRALQVDLRNALANGELELAYQPQVDSVGDVVGVEALARWTHRERGVVPPSIFIPLAEECGLIVELGVFALRRAFQDSLLWPNLKVAVNVSAHQLRQKQFFQIVEDLVRETCAVPSQFELEITESLLIGDDPATHATLQKLSDFGFAIALDDFGTGYSSLSYLQRYPIDKIKIDRSFIVNLGIDVEAKAVICAIVTLAAALNLRVIAEGVETIEQRSSLMSAGCSDVQGFLTGRPVAASAISQLMFAQAGNDLIPKVPASTLQLAR